MSEIDQSVKEMFVGCAFEPADVIPKQVDIDAMSSKEKKHKEGKKDAKKDEQPRKLPKRLKLGAFSKVVGHRPMGLQIEQCKLYTKRFPTEFRLAAMGKVVLPCQGKLPYVTADGTLPSPILSTMNALKYLELHPDQLEHGEARAKKESIW